MRRNTELFLLLCLVVLFYNYSITFAANSTKKENKSTKVESIQPKKKKQFEININHNIFSTISANLNTQIYQSVADIINDNHLNQCYRDADTKLFHSYKEYLTPLIPIALTLCETGNWADTRYTWSSAIYSSPLVEMGVNMSELDVSKVDENTYLVNGIVKELGCGSNCTASNSIGERHYHIVNGTNDNDSLGPLQVLRRYVEENGYIEYPCGEITYDLMSWKDNVNYFFHRQCDAFSSNNHWNKDHAVGSVYELVALVGVAHNTGMAFQKAKSSNGYAGSKWKNAGAVYDYCELIGSEKSIKILSDFVDKHYLNIIDKATNNEKFTLAGQYRWDSLQFKNLLSELGVVQSNYVNGQFSHKQIYPLRVVLNYMTLERLYTSGNIER